MPEYTQISLRVDKAARDMAHALNINISDVCRQAINDEIGLQLEKNPKILVSTQTALEKYIELLERQKEQQTKLFENITIVTDNIRKESEKQKELETRNSKIRDIISKMYGNKPLSEIAPRVLPEYNGGNFTEFDRINAKVMDIFGKGAKINILDLLRKELIK